MFPLGTGYQLTGIGRAACGVTAGLFAAVLVLAATVDPDPRGYGTHERLGLPPCGFHLMFSIPCPSCGSTTSFAHFVRGRFGESLRSNPAALFLAMGMTVAIPWLTFSSVCGRLLGVHEPLKWTAILACVLVVIALIHWLSKVTLVIGPLSGIFVSR